MPGGRYDDKVGIPAPHDGAGCRPAISEPRTGKSCSDEGGVEAFCDSPTITGVRSLSLCGKRLVRDGS